MTCVVRIVAAAALLLAAVAPVSHAKTLRWSYQTDVTSLDPQDRRFTFVRDFLGNIMEPLARFNGKLELEPALAESWEQPEPKVWRFHLRKGVTFSNGDPFTADDVIFTYRRGADPVSAFRGILRTVDDVRKINSHTVDFILNTPYPILLRDLSVMYIFNKKWVEANGGAAPVEMVEGKVKSNFLQNNVMGTGPFMLKSYEPDSKTVLVPNPTWWGTPRHNLTEVIFTPIQSGATRVAALLSGQVDMIFPVPPQDVPRIERTPGFKILSGPELRSLFIGMDQGRDELLESNVKGKNPFKDIRVRRAVYQAIDVETIRQKIMSGQATPTGLIISPLMNGFDQSIAGRFPFDPVAARKLLVEAGYPDGFEVTFDCSASRAVNEAQICTAIAAMLEKIGVTARLNVQPSSKHFDKILGLKSSFYTVSWAGLPTIDALGTLNTVMHSRQGAYGTWNLGGYANPQVDNLIKAVETEQDGAKRNALIRDAMRLHKEDIGHIPIHTQHSAWAVRDGISLSHAADDNVRLLDVVIK